jgi:hypothetical protein
MEHLFLGCLAPDYSATVLVAEMCTANMSILSKLDFYGRLTASITLIQ